MAENQTLKILEVCRVVPPPDSYSSSPATLSPTFFDLLWLRFPPVQRLYFYQISHKSIFFQTIVPKLKSSLSLILQHYAPLAGNFIWPQHSYKPTIQAAPGNGVLFTVAESDADFYHLSSNNLRETIEYDPLLPEFPSSDDQTVVMTLQVTVFQTGGFCIGISTHHALLDGRTSTEFMKSWARMCKLDRTSPSSSSPTAELTPFYDRTMIKDSKGLEVIYLNAWLNLKGPNNRSLMIWDAKAPPESVRATFQLTPKNLQNLKRLSAITNFSTFTLTTALTWICLAKAEDSSNSKISLVLNVDARARLEPPMPAGYFGNCIVGRIVVADRESLVGEDGVRIAAEAINGATKNLHSADTLLDGAEQCISWLDTINTAGDKMVGVAGSPRFEVYSVDFGWGKPRKVEMASIDKTGAICLSDSPNGGVEICLVRQRDIMERFATHFTQDLQRLSIQNVCDYGAKSMSE
ncbi:malonyl-coenzyme:anthocyanin 5-O-glucoside-6'''-O-malonyltransferase-like isoform X2 [Momordica charantia]|uniref:Malonyl-coenzyme:anthocyanin 5-O-glucoside-6'''-O-malonyltransferase-like isoform X2 n=1 Tax=Momordica charantia TaxID=3673 RepID=A0A6J1D6Q3_MOMCH|nr:malonyl-coenzyme:anthocyanin 5-O-glucoside-6'''-O-malonyltransferase-like isoform X2 [Momordica charantia]